MRLHRRSLRAIGTSWVFATAVLFCRPILAQSAEAVVLPTLDGDIALTGYLYRPDPVRWPGARPAVVMLHGRTGVFSATAKRLNEQTLSGRTVLWGRFWAERGYVGLYVDSFGPRGHPRGFNAGTNRAGQRPVEVNEITVRPLDARRGLQFLRAREDVDASHVFLQGWSNGGSATLASVHARAPGASSAASGGGFRAAVALYPACRGVERHFGRGFAATVPLLLLIGTADEEVSFSACEDLADAARAGELEFVAYPDAQHSFDSPTSARRSVPANVKASEDALQRVEAFFAQHRKAAAPARP